MQIRRLAIALVLALFGVLHTPMLWAYERARSEYGAALRLPPGPVRVRQTSPVPGLSSGGKEVLRRALANWSETKCVEFLLVAPNDTAPALIEVRPIVSGWAYGDTIAAHTELKSDPFSGEILSALIELDATRLYSEAEQTPDDSLDTEAIFVHELGHALGLGHSTDPKAIMHAGIQPGPRLVRRVSSDDIAGICGAPRASAKQDPERAQAHRFGSGVLAAFALAFVVAFAMMAFLWKKRKKTA